MMDWDGTERRGTNPLIRLHEDVAETRKTVELMYTQLLGGDGQPGAIANIIKNMEKLEERVDDLDGWRKWVNGVSAAVGAVFAGLMALLGLRGTFRG